LLAHKAITGPAATHRRTPAQVLFRYLTQIGVVPLTGTKSEAHMREDLSIFDFQLSPEECSTIHKIL
jgi:diketogulonate reductase-like aldo/keto reductase